MKIPRKFESLIEGAEINAPIPDSVWLDYAVCLNEKDACGWVGWIIGAAFKQMPPGTPGVWHKEGAVLSAADNQNCPNCGQQTFRTGVTRKFILDQSNPRAIDMEYETVPIEYE